MKNRPGKKREERISEQAVSTRAGERQDEDKKPVNNDNEREHLW